MPKTICVEVKEGRHRHEHAFYDLAGIPNEEPLRPRHCRTALALLDLDPAGKQVTVWGVADDYGYAVYPVSQTKVKRTFEWPENATQLVAEGVI